MAARKETGAGAAGVYAVVGADTYLAEQVLEELLSGWVGAERSDSVQVLRGDEASWGRVLEAARTGSLFAARRAVVVRGADALKGEGDELAGYLDDPCPDARVVFMAARPDKRRTVWKRLLDKAEVRTAEPLRGRAARSYVAEQVRRRKLALREDAFEELFERVGQDLRRVMGELDKLEAFADGHRGPLGAEEVSAVMGRGLAQPLYRIGDAFTGRRRPAVLALMEAVLDDGEPPLKVLATLHYAARRVRAARALREARMPREALAGRLGVPPFKVQELMEASRAWSEVELERAVAALAEADRRIKTGGDARAALVAAVVEATKTRAPWSAR
ncbi:MAG TPA: DNA polymerase III subunit delta [Vicinamibacteria bacterium]|nr:DNA polymerase III subunit delta [Vicinamibacteria bacterium]